MMAEKGHRLKDLFGMLGTPPRSLTLEQMDEAIARAVVENYERSRRSQPKTEDDGEDEDV